ncbi:hypothetical protein [Burkholderia gladioli]|uniref:hypothetical protein n=1 Tax=Burkholderia gladioli TaxID=28095 RepID=UPI001641195A|nr:hypothetical protein [Burkholderia gladioli]
MALEQFVRAIDFRYLTDCPVPRKTLRSLSVTNAGTLTIIGWTFCPLCQSRAGHRLPVHPYITQVRFLFSDN